MTKINYTITNKSTIFMPHERIPLGLNFIARLIHLQRMKQLTIDIDEEKLAIEGHKTIMAGNLHLDIKREDFRGSSVNYSAFNLFGIILGSLLILLGIFALIVYIADLFGNDGDNLPLGLGFLFLAVGLLILIPSLFKKTILILRFVDKNSNSVRHIALKVRRNAQEYYKTAKEFTEKIWSG